MPNKPKKITLRTPADLVSAVPHLLGFAPSESLVMMTTGPTFAARVDLPCDEFDRDEIIAALLQPARQHSVQTAMFLTYTGNDEASTAILCEIRSTFEGADIVCPTAIQVDGNAFRTVDPIGFGEWTEVMRETEIVRETFANTPTPLNSRSALARKFAPEPELPVVKSSEPIGDFAAYRCAVDGGEHTSNELLSHLLSRVLDPEFRSLMITDLADYNAREHVEVWSRLVRVSPEGESRQHAASLAALAAWVTGNGALAWVAHDFAGDTALARIVSTLLTDAVNPVKWDVDETGGLRDALVHTA